MSNIVSEEDDGSVTVTQKTTGGRTICVSTYPPGLVNSMNSSQFADYLKRQSGGPSVLDCFPSLFSSLREKANEKKALASMSFSQLFFVLRPQKVVKKDIISQSFFDKKYQKIRA